MVTPYSPPVLPGLFDLNKSILLVPYTKSFNLSRSVW